MTDQERQQGFYNAIKSAELTYGLTLRAEVKAEQLGEAVLIRPGLVIVPLPNWEQEVSNGSTGLSEDDVRWALEFRQQIEEFKKTAGNGHTNGTPTNMGVNLIENPTQDKDTTHETSV